MSEVEKVKKSQELPRRFQPADRLRTDPVFEPPPEASRMEATAPVSQTDAPIRWPRVFPSL